MTLSTLMLRNVRKSYPAFELGPVSLELAPGSIVGLLGPNGAGKTTLMNLIALQSRMTSGEMTYGPGPIHWGDAAWKSRISYIRETHAFYDELTIRDTLRFAARVYDEWDQGFADALVTRFGLDVSQLVGTLSRGTRVKVGLVAALAYRARFLLLDEPTAGLDPDARDELNEIVREIVRQRPDTCVLFSSHIFQDLEGVADRVVIVRDGRVVVDRRRAELADDTPLATLYRESKGL